MCTMRTTEMLCADYTHHMHARFWNSEMLCSHYSTRRIEKIQRATKLVYGFKEVPYKQRMCPLKIQSMYYRRARGDMIEVFKYFHVIYKTENPHCLETPNARTRGHYLKLKKWYSKLDLQHNFLGFRVVDLWNDLPERVVTADRVKCLKSRLDAYWPSITYCGGVVRVSGFFLKSDS